MSEELLRVPEIARRLGIEGAAVYELIAQGELAGGKGRNGMVYVPADSVRLYERRHATTSP